MDVRLNYVSASQKLSDLLFGKGVIKPPVVEMASVKGKIDGPAPVKEMPGFTSIFLVMAILIFYGLVRRINIR